MKKPIRPIRVEGNIAYVPLTLGYEAVVDVCDIPLVDRFNWSAMVTFRRDGGVRSIYAVRKIRAKTGRKKVYMHRSIIDACEERDVDHINSNGIDNRRINLRLASKSQNQHNGRIAKNNTSGFKGVYWKKDCLSWVARICVSGKQIYLGRFSSAKDAGDAYSLASKIFHGEFGRTV